VSSDEQGATGENALAQPREDPLACVMGRSPLAVRTRTDVERLDGAQLLDAAGFVELGHQRPQHRSAQDDVSSHLARRAEKPCDSAATNPPIDG